MGNVRFGHLAKFSLKSILAAVLFFSFIPLDSSFARGPTCSSFFTGGERTGSSTFRDNKQLKIATWNVFNLKIPEIEYPEGSEIQRNTPRKEQLSFSKSEEMQLEMKKVFDDLDADIYVLQEVFSKESLQHFVSKYLANKYDVVLERGNDERGIQVGFLIKKSLGISYELQSHKDLKFERDYGVYPAGTPIFSRDLPALYLRQKDGSNARASDEPDLVIFGAHFKSKRPTEGDFESTNKREVEAQTAARIISETNARYQGRVPIMLAGDLNTGISAPETQSLREKFKDALGLMGDKLSEKEKVTHTFHPLVESKNAPKRYFKDGRAMPSPKFEGRVRAHQVDVQYLNESMAGKLVDSRVYHYKDILGQDKVYGREHEIYPVRFKERKENPSDHMPIISIFDMTK